MAFNDNFVFQDPRIQAGVIGIAQIRAAEEAARLQRQSQSQQSFTQAQVARDNAAAERARNDAYLNQREREAARSDVTLNKDLEIRRQMYTGRETDKDKIDRINTQFETLKLAATQGRLTPNEWISEKERIGKDLTDDHKLLLDGYFNSTRTGAQGASDMYQSFADEWNLTLNAKKKTTTDPNAWTTALSQIIKDATKARGKYIRYDATLGQFVPLSPAVREDKIPLGPPAPDQQQYPFVPPPPPVPVENFLPKSTGLGLPGVLRMPYDAGFSIGGWLKRQFGGGSPKPVQSFVPPMGQPGSASPYDYPPRSFAPTWQPEHNYPEGFWQDGDVPSPTPPPSQIQPMTPFMPNIGPVPFINPRDLMTPPTPPPSASINNPNNLLMALASLFGQGRGAGMQAQIQNPPSSFYVASGQPSFVPPPYLPVT